MAGCCDSQGEKGEVPSGLVYIIRLRERPGVGRKEVGFIFINMWIVLFMFFAAMSLENVGGFL